jgi:hypothetical protein
MEYETGKYRSNANMDVLRATKELLGNNQYAIDAIRSRNKRIRDLVDIITHQTLAFKEIEERYDQMSREKDYALSKLSTLENNYAVLYDDWKQLLTERELNKIKFDKLKDDYEVIIALRDRTLSRKIEMYAEKVGGKRGAFIKLVFTPPMTKIWSILFIITIFIASIIGWTPVLAFLKAIVSIFF